MPGSIARCRTRSLPASADVHVFAVLLDDIVHRGRIPRLGLAETNRLSSPPGSLSIATVTRATNAGAGRLSVCPAGQCFPAEG